MASATFVLRPRVASAWTRAKCNAHSKQLRADRKEAGECVNGCGKATHGCRCFRCWLVHRVGVTAATLLLLKPVGHCVHCEQLIPEGYSTSVDGALAHERCARRLRQAA